MLRRQRQLCPRITLDSIPIRNPEVQWEELDTGQMMVVYRPRVGRVGKFLRRLFAVRETIELLLDEAGAKVVREIDGRKTLADLIAYVSGEFKLGRKDSEASLLRFMRMLGQRRLVGFLARPVAEND